MKEIEYFIQDLSDFGFDSEDELITWSETLTGDWRLSEKDTRVLYTDGDSGIVMFSWSEIEEENGMCITLINCFWCDIDFNSLRKIERVLRAAYRKPVLNDED